MRERTGEEIWKAWEEEGGGEEAEEEEGPKLTIVPENSRPMVEGAWGGSGYLPSRWRRSGRGSEGLEGEERVRWGEGRWAS